eukprot:1071052-Pyramimonas_sp.AAC.1
MACYSPSALMLTLSFGTPADSGDMPGAALRGGAQWAKPCSTRHRSRHATQFFGTQVGRLSASTVWGTGEEEERGRQ